MPQDDLVSTADAAFLLGVSVATVNRWARRGRLNVAYQALGKTGPRWFYKDELEDERRRICHAAVTAPPADVTSRGQ